MLKVWFGTSGTATPSLAGNVEIKHPSTDTDETQQMSEETTKAIAATLSLPPNDWEWYEAKHAASPKNPKVGCLKHMCLNKNIGCVYVCFFLFVYGFYVFN